MTKATSATARIVTMYVLLRAMRLRAKNDSTIPIASPAARPKQEYYNRVPIQYRSKRRSGQYGQ